MKKEKEIGIVTHYFDKVMVAVIKLNGKLAVGDTVKIIKGENEFETEIESMEVDHEKVKSGKKGDEVAIKISSPTKDGALVYKA